MKKIYLIFAAILLVSSFVACGNEDVTGEIDMKIEKVQFTAKGGETELQPKVSGDFDVFADQDWIKFSVDEGVIILKVPPFFNGEGRKGNIEIRSKTENRKINIVQLSEKLKINGTKNITSTINEEREYKFAVEKSFKGEQSRMALRLKDEKDGSWLKAEFTGDNEITVTKKKYPTMKAAASVIYLDLNGDAKTTVMDSIVVNVSFLAQDLINTKWIASYVNEKSVSFEEEVEILAGISSRDMYLKGLSVYEDSTLPADFIFSYSDWNKRASMKLSSPYRQYPLAVDDNGNEIHLLGVTKKMTTWDIMDDKAPFDYGAKIINEGDKVVISFLDEVYEYSVWGETPETHPMRGFLLKSYKMIEIGDYDYTYEPIETTRWILDLKLTLISE